MSKKKKKYDPMVRVRITGTQRVTFNQTREMPLSEYEKLAALGYPESDDQIGSYIDVRDVHDGEEVEDCEISLEPEEKQGS
jgi:hypothetical protein